MGSEDTGAALTAVLDYAVSLDTAAGGVATASLPFPLGAAGFGALGAARLAFGGGGVTSGVSSTASSIVTSAGATSKLVTPTMVDSTMAVAGSGLAVSAASAVRSCDSSASLLDLTFAERSRAAVSTFSAAETAESASRWSVWMTSMRAGIACSGATS